jgi:hypothetical protein
VAVAVDDDEVVAAIALAAAFIEPAVEEVFFINLR